MQASPLQFGFQRAYFFSDVRIIPSSFLSAFQEIKNNDRFTASGIRVTHIPEKPDAAIYGVSGHDHDFEQLEDLEDALPTETPGVQIYELADYRTSSQGLSGIQKLQAALQGLLSQHLGLPIHPSLGN